MNENRPNTGKQIPCLEYIKCAQKTILLGLWKNSGEKCPMLSILEENAKEKYDVMSGMREEKL